MTAHSFISKLPVYYTPYIDRDEEQTEVARLLSLPTTRLVTLTGPPGCGKSRLALQVATSLASSFPGRVHWIDLAAVAEPSLFPQAIATALGIHEIAHQPLMKTVLEALCLKHTLLVLDNADCLATGWPPASEASLATCVNLRILVTSREALGMDGEHVIRLSPFPVPTLGSPPSLDTLQTIPVIRLFVECSRRALPTFALTKDNAGAAVEICRQLDGLPLAVELAAARLRALSLEQIVTRLDDRLRLLRRQMLGGEPRHHTLETALDWSYRLLSPAEQVLFRRLSVFKTSFTLDSVEAICASPGEDVIDTLTRLIDRSLVEVGQEQSGTTHYRLLNTLAVYARGKLTETDETNQFERRHAQFFLDWMERTSFQAKRGEWETWLRQVEAQQGDLHQALDWFIAHGEAKPALRLSVALSEFWEVCGTAREGRSQLERVLALPVDLVNGQEADLMVWRARACDRAAALAHLQSDYTAARQFYETSAVIKQELGDEQGHAVILDRLGMLAKDQGDYSQAETLYDQSLAIFQALNDTPNLAAGLMHLGLLHHLTGHLARANQMYAQSLDLFEDLDDKQGIADALSNLSLLARNRGDYARARTLSQRSLALRQEIGNAFGQALSLANLGLIAMYQGDFAEAKALQEESLARFQALGNGFGIALLKCALALTALYQGDVTKAGGLGRESRRLFEAMGNKWAVAMALTTLALVAAREERYERAKALAREGLLMRHELGDRHGIAESLEALAEMAAFEGNNERTALLLGGASAIRQAIGAPLSPVESSDMERWLPSVRQALSEERYVATVRKGETMGLADIVAYALDTQAPQGATPEETPARIVTPSSPSVTVVEPELRIFGFGAARVYRGDSLLTPADWSYAKPKELLFFLLSRGARTKEQIGVMLFPDASAAQLRTSFHPALHHLRQALGRKEWVLLTRDGYVFNRALPYTYDVEVFETRIAEAHSLRKQDQQQAIESLEAALPLYRGDFLSDIVGASEWILLRREDLRHLYEEGLLTLGELLLTTRRYEDAVEVYRRAIAHDSLLEEAHRGLMQALDRMGEHGQAIRHYQRLTALLKDELGGQPARETKALYERLIQGGDD